MHHQVKCRRDFFQSPQNAPQQRRQLLAIRTRPRLLEQMIVPPVHQPDFVGHARRIGTQRVILALHIHDALSLLLFLANGVAENAALFVLKPFVRRAQFILDAPRHKNCRRHLRVRVRPFFPGHRALVLENADVFESRIFFQVRDARRPNPQHTLDLFVAELRHPLVVRRRLHHHFVSTDRAHLVVHAFRGATGLAFDVVQRLGMRDHANLPRRLPPAR